MREGLLKLWDLWIEFRPFFPLSFSDVTPARVLVSIPFIVKLFIVLVSSICAILVGALWGFSGLAEVLRARRGTIHPADLDQPALVAESLREGQAQYWRSASWLFRKLASVWPRVRLVTPVSYEIFRDLTRSSAKFLAVVVLVALVVYFVQLTPVLLKKYLQVTIELAVPSATPLYVLLFFLMLANALIAVSLVPLLSQEFVRTCHLLPVHGAGDPHLFFALLEEGCRLLSAAGQPDRKPVRLEQKETSTTKGTLIESYPESVQAFSRPAAYVCLPFIFLLLTMGFSRLINFQRPVGPMHYVDFLAYHSLDYVLEVAFALGLILAGLYLAELARRMFGIRRFRSALVFCYAMKTGSPTNLGASSNQLLGPRMRIKWKVAQGVDDQFAGWAKDPGRERKFSVQLCWAEAFSEASTAEAARFLIRLEQSSSLDEAMKHLSELPFHVGFQTEAAAGPAPEEPPNKKAHEADEIAEGRQGRRPPP
ncbi:MAG: hypothetical protein HY913_10055 [Desulfomonile tiedjei]|nr:hypothetical protein [Desulfomonile tiedjei]